MTAIDLAKYLIDCAEGQLTRTLNALDRSALDSKLYEGGMTMKEQVNHLAEAYQAVIVTADGGKYEDWGTFKLQATEFEGMVTEAMELRAKAVSKVLVDDEAKLKIGCDYIIGHDFYHVGQLVPARLKAFPDWNSYEIYG